jgi:hypothetical protein
VRCGELKAEGNEAYDKASVVMLEADLDSSPRTLRFFVDGREQPFFVSNIPQSINFAVCLAFLFRTQRMTCF